MKATSFIVSIRKPDRKSLSLFLWLNMNLITATVRFILNSFGVDSGVEREFFIFIATCIPFAVLIMGTNKCIIQKEIMIFIRLYLMIVLAAVASFLLNPDLREYYFREMYGIGPVFRLDGAPFAFLFFSLNDSSEKTRKVLLVTAFVSLLYLVFVVLFPALRRGYFYDIAPRGGMKKFQYSLSLGYDLILPLTVFFISALRGRNKVYYGLALICVILIVLYGGRGAMVVMAFMLLLLLLIGVLKKRHSVFGFFLIVSVILVVFVLMLFGEYLLAAIIDGLEKMNINSRTIQTFLNGSFSEPNGRDLIWKRVWEAIVNGGPFGYGFFGDRPFGAVINYVGYSHNLFLELISNFGILGVLVIFYIISDATRMLFMCNDENYKMIYVVLFVCSCKLMLSFSFWYTWEFWAAAAVAYKYRHIKKKKTTIDKDGFSEESNRKESPI